MVRRAVLPGLVGAPRALPPFFIAWHINNFFFKVRAMAKLMKSWRVVVLALAAAAEALQLGAIGAVRTAGALRPAARRSGEIHLLEGAAAGVSGEERAGGEAFERGGERGRGAGFGSFGK